MRKIGKIGAIRDIRSHFAGGGGGGDADAAAYIAAASIVDGTEISAIEQLFLDLKGTGSTTNNTNIYSKFFALYLISPTGLSAASVNAVTPATFDLTFFNSPIHSATGVAFNGTTQYINSAFTPSTDGYTVNSAGYSQYNNGATLGYSGCRVGASNRIVHRFAAATGHIGFMWANFFGTTTVADTNELFTITRTGTTRKDYRAGVEIATGTDSGTVPNIPFYIHARNNAGSADNHMNGQLRTAAIHSDFTANEAEDFNDAVVTYNTALSR